MIFVSECRIGLRDWMEDGVLMRVCSLRKVWDYGHMDGVGGRYEEMIRLDTEVRAELSNGNTEMWE